MMQAAEERMLRIPTKSRGAFSRFATSSGDWLALTQDSTRLQIDLLRNNQQPWLTAHFVFKPSAILG